MMGREGGRERGTEREREREREQASIFSLISRGPQRELYVLVCVNRVILKV